jgi:hypothetical protein
VIVAKTEDQLDLDVYNGKKEYVEEDEELLAEAAALVGGGRNASKQGATSDPAAAPVADPAPSAAAPTFNLDTAAGALNFSPASALAGQDDDMCGIGNGSSAETASDSRQA